MRSEDTEKLSFRNLSLIAFGLFLVAFALIFTGFQVAGKSVHPDKPVARSAKGDLLRLTIPKMKRVKNVPVFTAASNNERQLDASVIRLKGTGLPWQKQANVYIVGHRLGYPNTGSFLVFYDLNKMRKKDIVVLRDSKNKRYVYKVFRKMIVPPSDLQVTKPIEGKNIVSLQSCTLPTYTKRIVVQARLVRSNRMEARQPSKAHGGDKSSVTHHQ